MQQVRSRRARRRRSPNGPEMRNYQKHHTLTFLFSLSSPFAERLDVRPAFEFSVWVESGRSAIQPFKCRRLFGTRPLARLHRRGGQKTIRAKLKKISQLTTLNSQCSSQKKKPSSSPPQVFCTHLCEVACSVALPSKLMLKMLKALRLLFFPSTKCHHPRALVELS